MNGNGLVKLIDGQAIPSPDGNQTNCSFIHIDFSEVECVNFSENPEGNEYNRQKLKTIMNGKNYLLWIRPIGGKNGVGGLKYRDKNNEEKSLLNNDEIASYDGVACGIGTPYGTIIPQIIVPSNAYKGTENGIVIIDENGNKNERHKSQYEGGYNWIPRKFSEQQAVQKGYSSEDAKKIVNDIRTYGLKNTECKYIYNYDSAKGKLDDPVYNRRMYDCNTSESEAGSGACAICYSFTDSKPIGIGSTKEEKEQAPSIGISLAGLMSDFGNENGENQQSMIPYTVNNETAIVAGISTNGTVIAAVGSETEKGAFLQPANDCMPPHCQKIDDKYILNPLFFYPIYQGMIVTNSILKNALTGGNDVFIKYNNEIQNPIYIANVNGVSKSNEIKKSITKDGHELMRWFPTLFQESDNVTGIKVNVKPLNNVKFGDNVSIMFNKSVGRFAYCPIFFHRKLCFTMYFKGNYISNGETEGEYYFYPLACADIGEGDDNNWKGIGNDGATCISTYRHVVDDDNVQESIYAVDFEFTSSTPQRYPIEIFGVVIAYKRKAFQFQNENGNGDFQFNQSIIPQFTGALAEQEKFHKNFFGVIDNCSLSASLNGVTGSISLDGYPLSQGIKEFRQKQSIGELDIAVQQGDFESPLFSGYGMEISTTDNDGSNAIGVNLYGINKKMEDMKVICCPFWDGDRLEMICAYFEAYLGLKIKMIDHTVHSYAEAKSVSDELYTNVGTWSANASITNSNNTDMSTTFRVPRSSEWTKPAVDFKTGTTCYDALKKLGEFTGCHCVPQLDGTIVFYELNRTGIPYYVNNQDNVEYFDVYDIMSINMNPFIENKYNNIATFGMLHKKGVGGKIIAQNNIEFGAFYTKTNDPYTSEDNLQFPWSKPLVGVEPAMLTKSELSIIHRNRVKFASKDFYKGTVQVVGNTRVNHMYQKINICGTEYYVISINHSINLSNKVWTTEYGIQQVIK